VTRQWWPGAFADRNKCYCGEGSAFPQRAMYKCYFDGVQDAMPWEVSLAERPLEREGSNRHRRQVSGTPADAPNSKTRAVWISPHKARQRGFERSLPTRKG
jgi:hypothetical protein